MLQKEESFKYIKKGIIAMQLCIYSFQVRKKLEP